MTLPCDTCGACCRNHGENGVPVGPKAKDIDRRLHNRLTMLTVLGNCAALDGNRCTIYDHRPPTCEQFVIGGDLCNRFRASEGLPEIPLYTEAEERTKEEDTDRRAKLQQLDAATATPDAWGNLTAAQRSEAQRVSIRLTLALARRLLP